MRKIYFLLIVSAALSGCKKSDSTIPAFSTFFGRFNGFAASISTMNNDPHAGSVSYTAVNVPISASQSNGSYISTISGPDFSVSFTKAKLVFAGTGIPSASEFQAFFSTGSVPYSSAIDTSGIAITYVDINLDTWNSALGDQTGSVFTINQTQSFGINVAIEAVFNCKLYDGSGNVITLSGGTFTGQFSPI